MPTSSDNRDAAIAAFKTRQNADLAKVRREALFAQTVGSSVGLCIREVTFRVGVHEMHFTTIEGPSGRWGFLVIPGQTFVSVTMEHGGMARVSTYSDADGVAVFPNPPDGPVRFRYRPAPVTTRESHETGLAGEIPPQCEVQTEWLLMP